MPTYAVAHTTQFIYHVPALVCHNETHLQPLNTDRQRRVTFDLTIVPTPTHVTERTDYFGNEVNGFAIYESHASLSVTSRSTVEVFGQPVSSTAASPAWEFVRDLSARPLKSDLSVTEMTFDSPRVHRNTDLASYVAISFTPGRPIMEAATELMRRIYQDFKYDSRATNVNTSLAEVLELRAGVCQDLAHVGIGCLRSLGLAARYVSGYLRTQPPPGKPRLVGADESHAWYSLYCGELGWVDFDPTNNVIPNNDHIWLGYGRDYGDVCPVQGVFTGGGDHKLSVQVDVEEITQTPPIALSGDPASV